MKKAIILTAVATTALSLGIGALQPVPAIGETTETTEIADSAELVEVAENEDIEAVEDIPAELEEIEIDAENDFLLADEEEITECEKIENSGEYEITEASSDDVDLDFYKLLAADLSEVEIYDSADLTLEILENRNGKIIIEEVIGVVEDEDGNGRVLNPEDENYNYIHYGADTKPGNIVLTYLIYNPDSNVCDDILERFDYVIDSRTE